MGIDLDVIQNMHVIATKGFKPHLTFLLDVPIELGHRKLLTNEFGKKDRIERKGAKYHEKVRQGYLEMARKEPERIKVIRYIEGGIDEMHKQIIKHAEEILKTTKWQKSLQETLS